MEAFGVLIQDLIKQGTSQTIFKQNEWTDIIQSLRNQEMQKRSTREEILANFYKKVKTNIHYLIHVSPQGNHLDLLSSEFPQLFATIPFVLVSQWPTAALKDLVENNLEHISVSQAIAKSLPSVASHVHQASITISLKEQSKKNGIYFSPVFYLEFIHTLFEQFSKKLLQIPKNVKKFEDGINQI